MAMVRGRRRHSATAACMQRQASAVASAVLLFGGREGEYFLAGEKYRSNMAGEKYYGGKSATCNAEIWREINST
jgi:hypothetical protein